MTTCARCGHELGIGRFCLNCGHPAGEPVTASEPRFDVPDDAPLPDQASSGTPAWVTWAVGAVLVVILFVVLASCLGGDDDPAADTATETASTTSPQQHDKPARPIDLTRTLTVAAPAAAPATNDLDGELVTYAPRRMLDATPSTAWRTAGDATGQTITFTLAEPTLIRRVGLINGYAKQVPSGASLVDWYPNNRRITAVEWVFDDGTVVRQDLVEKARLQRLTIDPVTTASVQLRLVTVTAPGVGVLGRDYTAISDILIAGTPTA
ncbi:NADase-type glycan-binding domain-containing protein [Nocardioides sp.]|uniref:NADase-type glycan-binding domain-containing protein n=1 Tax=Nocardioides sp. TaxID=35761 RepID=UPI00286DD0D8|nr:hypothetical protein [Nocardioides sp.]